MVTDVSSAATKNSTSWQRYDLIPAWSSYFRTQPVCPLLGDNPHPLLWHQPRPRGPSLEPQPCLRAARATPPRCPHEFVGRSATPVPALGHLSLTASLQTIWEEAVPCGHTGTPLTFKHGARTSLSVRFFWATTKGKQLCTNPGTAHACSPVQGNHPASPVHLVLSTRC